MTKKDTAADARSQAHAASAEHEQVDGNEPEKAAKASGTGADAGIQFFSGTIVKIDKDGNEVMSDHLAPGEKLRRPSTDRYTRSAANAKPEYEAGK